MHLEVRVVLILVYLSALNKLKEPLFIDFLHNTLIFARCLASMVTSSKNLDNCVVTLIHELALSALEQSEGRPQGKDFPIKKEVVPNAAHYVYFYHLRKEGKHPVNQEEIWCDFKCGKVLGEVRHQLVEIKVELIYAELDLFGKVKMVNSLTSERFPLNKSKK